MRSIVVKKLKGNNNKCLLVVDHEEHKIEVEVTSGSALEFDEYLSILLYDKDVRKELNWALTSYKRLYPIGIKYREGMSGCVDITLVRSIMVNEESLLWKTKAMYKPIYKFHISCVGKLNEGTEVIFSGDLLELLYYILNIECDCITSKQFRFRTVKKFYKYEPYYIGNSDIFDLGMGVCGSLLESRLTTVL